MLPKSVLCAAVYQEIRMNWNLQVDKKSAIAGSPCNKQVQFSDFLSSVLRTFCTCYDLHRISGLTTNE